MISKLSAIANLFRSEAKYIRHLETRAMKAEAERDLLRNKLAVIESTETAAIATLDLARAERDAAIALLRAAPNPNYSPFNQAYYLMPVYLQWFGRAEPLSNASPVTYAETRPDAKAVCNCNRTMGNVSLCPVHR